MSCIVANTDNVSIAFWLRIDTVVQKLFIDGPYYGFCSSCSVLRFLARTETITIKAVSGRTSTNSNISAMIIISVGPGINIAIIHSFQLYSFTFTGDST